MIDIKKLFERKYADFILEVEKRLDEKAIEDYETEKVRVGLKLFEKYENNTQQIDELSKKTLGNYIKKASDGKEKSLINTAFQMGKVKAGQDEVDRMTNRHGNSYQKRKELNKIFGTDDETENKLKKTAINRIKGISRATDKLTKESNENLNEAFAVVRSKEDKSYVTYIPLKKGRASEDLEAIQKQGKYTVITYYQDESKARDKVRELTKKKVVKESKPISQDLDNDIVKHLKTLSAPKLKKMINDAFDNLTNLKRPITNGWDAPKTNDVNELIDHIDDFCNNWNCTVDIKNNKIVKTSSLHEGVAETILDQLGGKRFLLMTGSSPLSKSENSVTINIGKNKTPANRVKITLNGKDLYDVVFMTYRNLDNKVLKTFNDVYAEDLQDIFTDYTGLYTKL